jgi:hypothetical protein
VGGRKLHEARIGEIPLEALAYSPKAWPQRIATRGITIELRCRTR